MMPFVDNVGYGVLFSPYLYFYYCYFPEVLPMESLSRSVGIHQSSERREAGRLVGGG